MKIVKQSNKNVRGENFFEVIEETKTKVTLGDVKSQQKRIESELALVMAGRELCDLQGVPQAQVQIYNTANAKAMVEQ